MNEIKRILIQQAIIAGMKELVRTDDPEQDLSDIIVTTTDSIINIVEHD
jgi:hypothetical protein